MRARKQRRAATRRMQQTECNRVADVREDSFETGWRILRVGDQFGARKFKKSLYCVVVVVTCHVSAVKFSVSFAYFATYAHIHKPIELEYSLHECAIVCLHYRPQRMKLTTHTRPDHIDLNTVRSGCGCHRNSQTVITCEARPSLGVHISVLFTPLQRTAFADGRPTDAPTYTHTRACSTPFHPPPLET